MTIFMCAGMWRREPRTTPFDMTVLNAWIGFAVARCHPARASACVGGRSRARSATRRAPRRYVSEYGEDLPEVKNWTGTLS